MKEEMMALIHEIYYRCVGIKTLEDGVDPRELDTAIDDVVGLCEGFLSQPGAKKLSRSLKHETGNLIVEE